jgi:hypothetical protein
VKQLGSVRNRQDVAIRFTGAQLNDVLESLTTIDMGNGQVRHQLRLDRADGTTARRTAHTARARRNDDRPPRSAAGRAARDPLQEGHEFRRSYFYFS